MLFICEDLFPQYFRKYKQVFFIIIYSDGKHKKQYECEFCDRNSVVLQAALRYLTAPCS